MRKPNKVPKQRNPIARQLAAGIFRKRIVENKKLYTRKEKRDWREISKSLS